MSSSTITFIIITSIFILPLTLNAFSKQVPHIINFRFPNLYPESFVWDPISQHFIVSSLRHHLLHSISDAAVVDTLISDPSLLSSASFYGITLDSHRRRLLAALHSNSTPPFSAVVSYDLRSGHRIFLATLPNTDSSSSAAGADDITVDTSGNAYVTSAASNVIYKITPDGETSVLSRSPLFTKYSADLSTPYGSWGLNGIVYIDKGEGYLLVVQSNTGKMFKVNVNDGATTTVVLNKDLTDADGMAVRSDGGVVVVSPHKAYFIKGRRNWSKGVIYDEIALDIEKFAATSVTTGGEDRVYVLYGHAPEGIMGNAQREDFSIVQISSEKDNKEGRFWVFVLIGLGLACFLFWNFQMGRVATNVNRKYV